LATSVLFVAGLLGLTACSKDPSGTTQLSCATAPTVQVALPVGGSQEIDAACAAFAANASATDSAVYLVVPQAAGGSPGSTASFILQSTSPVAAAPAAQVSNVGSPVSTHSAALQFDQQLRAQVPSVSAATLRARPAPERSTAAPLAGPPAVGSFRRFYVCADPNCNTFTYVGAKVVDVGQHIAIYVDTLAPVGGLDSADIDTLAQLFDTRIYPVDTTAFGRESDIDNNSVVIALMTPVVNNILPKSQCFTTGYVTGFFYQADLDLTVASLYSDGEVIYTMVADTTDPVCPHARSTVKRLLFNTFAHELQHMINYNQHMRINKTGAEQIWLDEALSKYAEELAARTYLPGDSASFLKYTLEELNDAYIYLSAPDQHYLIAPTDGDLGSVGAGWLFMRYLVDQFSGQFPNLTHSLVNTPLIGTSNVTVHTGGNPFSNTAAVWALANWVSDLPGFVPTPQDSLILKYTSWSFRQAFANLHAQDTSGRYPLAFPLVPTPSASGQVSLAGTLHSGSGSYVLVKQPPGSGTFTLSFTGPAFAPLPSTLIPRLEVVRIH